ncbi:MAG: dynamin family protein [Comamonadaceae bacterium]|nr:dynamin family protein [Comamonadaceae bacterium]
MEKHPEQGATAAYGKFRKELLTCLDELRISASLSEPLCEELREKLETSTFNLVVVGQFKRGKTSLINALLGNELLPVAVVPLTSIVTILTYGPELTIRVYFEDGHALEIGSGELGDYVTERGNPQNRKDVLEVVVCYPSPYLKNGVRLIDTPGVGSIYQHNTDVAYHYLPKSDAAVFLLSVDQPMGRAELDFLRDVKEYSNKIFFLLNKADYLDAKDLQESIEFSQNVLKEAMGAEVRLFPISAKLALEGKYGAMRN